MAFELTTSTRAKVLDVRTLSRKDRKPDEPPGAQLLLSAMLDASTLAMFDGFLPSMLYRKGGSNAQGKLEGLEGVELTSIGEHVKRIPWIYEQTGAALIIHRATSDLELDDCKVHAVSFQPQKSGVLVQWKVDAPSLSDSTRGKLTGLKSTEIELTLTGPVVDDSQQTIPGTEGTDPNEKPAGGWPFPKNGSKGGAEASSEPQDATEAFTQAHGTPEYPPERKVGDTTVVTRRSRTSPPPAAH